MSEADFVCACEDWMREACAGLPYHAIIVGKRYCVLHCPVTNKVEPFREALQAKLAAKDFDFRGVFFPEAVDFYNVEFTAAADFRSATFEKPVNFTDLTLESRMDFGAARIEDALLFHDCQFVKQAELRFDTATFGAADRVSFHSVALHPAWFVNVNVREFEFTNVTWHNRQDYRRELALLKKILENKRENRLKSIFRARIAPTISSALTVTNDGAIAKTTKNDAMVRSASPVRPQRKAKRLLTVAYRHLAVNAEENHRYGEAADFRYAAMALWQPYSWREWGVTLIHRLYWLLSGFGERAGQAALILVMILTLSAVLYTQVGFEPKADKINPATKLCDYPNCPLTPGQAISHSLSVALLQRPEPKAATTPAKTIVALETLLAPLQAALLALAIRRRFMK